MTTQTMMILEAKTQAFLDGVNALAGQSVRLTTGNPLIMKQVVELVPDAGSYGPSQS